MAEIYRSDAGRHVIETRYRQILDGWPTPRDEIVVPTCGASGLRRSIRLVAGRRDPPPSEHAGHVLPPQTERLGEFLATCFNPRNRGTTSVQPALV